MSKAVHYIVSGFSECPYFRKALALAEEGSKKGLFTFTSQVSNRETYHQNREVALTALGKDVNFHRTCPLVYTQGNPGTYIGGCSEFTQHCKQQYKL